MLKHTQQSHLTQNNTGIQDKHTWKSHMTLSGTQRQIYYIMCYFQCNCDVLFWWLYTFSIRNVNFKLFTFLVHVTCGLQFIVWLMTSTFNGKIVTYQNWIISVLTVLFISILVYIFMKTFRNGKITYLLTYILLCLSDYRRLFHLLNYRWLYGFLQDSAIV